MRTNKAAMKVGEARRGGVCCEEGVVQIRVAGLGERRVRPKVRISNAMRLSINPASERDENSLCTIRNCFSSCGSEEREE